MKQIQSIVIKQVQWILFTKKRKIPSYLQIIFLGSLI